MKEDFYRAFEEKFRGSRSDIKQRISIYIPFIKALHSIYPSMQVLDIGCGRGEWLELLRDEGIDAFGVDLDQGMLSACEEIGLNVKKTDGVEYLQKLPNEHLEVISLFHLAEHLVFEQLQVVIMEAIRVLKPGGLLIIETPNPENLVVGTERFYLDPSHVRPIPMQLLMFLTEFAGFVRTKILRLQESTDVLSQPSISLLSVLSGVSPDYAIVAQKNAQLDILNKLSEVLDKEYGVDLPILANRYDACIQLHEARIKRLESLFERIQVRINQFRKFTYPLRYLFIKMKNVSGYVREKLT